MPGNDESRSLGLDAILAELDQVLDGLKSEAGDLPPPSEGGSPAPAAAPVKVLSAPPEPAAEAPKAPEAAPAAPAVPAEAAPPPPPPPAEPAAPSEFKFTPPPAGAPPEQVRRIAVCYAPTAGPNLENFVNQLAAMGQKSSQRPISVTPAWVDTFHPGADMRVVVKKAKESRCVALIIIVPTEDLKRDMEGLFADRDVFIKAITIEEMARRSVSVDLIVDLLLLRPLP